MTSSDGQRHLHGRSRGMARRHSRAFPDRRHRLSGVQWLEQRQVFSTSPWVAHLPESPAAVFASAALPSVHPVESLDAAQTLRAEHALLATGEVVQASLGMSGAPPSAAPLPAMVRPASLMSELRGL